ncbi:MAG: 3-phosphoserine/phosphohydroxythreonine transaminase [Candidatus Marinimicrobia bacterium]|jgi:phosphoserine aminotransferase|nr:3-phosphoserine/phosphohydroxythreonine transaminase [Candidatus Neomarinimicrobiota bacterium]MDP7216882.1 3-phosphoserine/phosphohydroxythreonine transaminase [Candidatus Neomarinimicrobiota bacterium]|tara:strand:- start:195 stop:1268 length:1074 start_codon:yes stop_codon:yes gene_type:complete
MTKVYNFSAGPAVLDQSVLVATAQAAKEYNNHGISLMEMSHRSKPVMDMVAETESLARDLLNIPDGYHVLFLQGGASLQFAMIPMNLLGEGQTADYTDTGAWSAKAIKEAKLFGNVNVACSSKESVYNHIPKNLSQSDNAIYLHVTSNNTIYGTQWKVFPNQNNSDGYLVADMSSDIFSRPIDVSQFGIIYAGAQKNMGPAGVTLVIIRDDILGKLNRPIPTMMNYQTHIDKGSMFNTPPVMSIYGVNRTLHLLKDNGGVEAMEEKNIRKAEKLYAEIERNPLFTSPIPEEDRSLMNVPFVFADGGDEADFLSFCDGRGLKTLKGHRSVGGFRASIYNAMPEAGVDALIRAMQGYKK